MVGKCAVCSSFDDLIVFFAGYGEQAAPTTLFSAGSMDGELEGQVVKVLS